MAWHNHKLREIDPSTNHVRIVAGGGAHAVTREALVTDVAPLSLFKQPKALERAPNGDLYILDQQNSARGLRCGLRSDPKTSSMERWREG